jgi:hypothetical protein
MKKLRLKALSLGAREILTREQLKSINGGCTSLSDCSLSQICNVSRGVCEDADPGGSSVGSGSGGTGGLCANEDLGTNAFGQHCYNYKTMVDGVCVDDPNYSNPACF